MDTFPALPGLGWPVKRRDKWTTFGSTSITSKFAGITYQQFPAHEFELVFNYLEASDLEQLRGLFNSSFGNLSYFLFDAGLGDNSVADQSFGVGDGATKDFQLYRTVGTFTDIVQKTTGTRSAKVAGVIASATFDVPNDGWVRFAAAPANGAALTWTGGYLYKCRFKTASQDFEEFVSQIHKAGSITLTTS